MRLQGRLAKVSIAARTETTTRERLLAKAKKLSERITRETIATGITQQELERDAYRAFLYVKRNRRSRRD